MSGRRRSARSDARNINGRERSQIGFFGQHEDHALIDFVVEEGHMFNVETAAGPVRMAEAFRGRFPEKMRMLRTFLEHTFGEVKPELMIRWRYTTKDVENRLLHIRNHIATYAMPPEKRRVLARNLRCPPEDSRHPGGGPVFRDRPISAAGRGNGPSSEQFSVSVNAAAFSAFGQRSLIPPGFSMGPPLFPYFHGNPFPSPVGCSPLTSRLGPFVGPGPGRVQFGVPPDFHGHLQNLQEKSNAIPPPQHMDDLSRQAAERVPPGRPSSAVGRPKPPKRSRPKLKSTLKGEPNWEGGYKLMVGSLGAQADTEDLERLFSRFGEVLRVYVVDGKGRQSNYAFICMKKLEEAEAAGVALNGRLLDGKPLRIEWANPPKGAKAQLSPTRNRKRERSPSRSRDRASLSNNSRVRRCPSRNLPPADGRRNDRKTSDQCSASRARRATFVPESPASPAASSSEADALSVVSTADFILPVQPAFPTMEGSPVTPTSLDVDFGISPGVAGIDEPYCASTAPRPQPGPGATHLGRSEDSERPSNVSANPLGSLTSSPQQFGFLSPGTSSRKQLVTETLDKEKKPGTTKASEVVHPKKTDRPGFLPSPGKPPARTETLDKTPRFYRALVERQCSKEQKTMAGPVPGTPAEAGAPVGTCNSSATGLFSGVTNLPHTPADVVVQGRPLASASAPDQASAGDSQIDVDAARVKKLMEKAGITAQEAFVLYTKNRSLYEKLGLDLDN